MRKLHAEKILFSIELKNQMRTVCAQWICLIHDSADFLGYLAVFVFIFYVNLFVSYVWD